MTYKSIDTTLLTAAGGPLVRFLPTFDPDQSEKRELLMTPQLYAWCLQSDRKRTADYKAKVRAFCGQFVKGDPVCNRDYMKSWRDDIWELRVQLLPKRENTRIFGGFLAPDCFVAFHPHQLRSDFGGKDDPQWDRAIEKTMSRWGAILPSHKRVVARPFSNCVTEKAFDHFR